MKKISLAEFEWRCKLRIYEDVYVEGLGYVYWTRKPMMGVRDPYTRKMYRTNVSNLGSNKGLPRFAFQAMVANVILVIDPPATKYPEATTDSYIAKMKHQNEANVLMNKALPHFASQDMAANNIPVVDPPATKYSEATTDSYIAKMKHQLAIKIQLANTIKSSQNQITNDCGKCEVFQPDPLSKLTYQERIVHEENSKRLYRNWQEDNDINPETGERYNAFLYSKGFQNLSDEFIKVTPLAIGIGELTEGFTILKLLSTGAAADDAFGFSNAIPNENARLSIENTKAAIGVFSIRNSILKLSQIKTIPEISFNIIKMVPDIKGVQNTINKDIKKIEEKK